VRESSEYEQSESTRLYQSEYSSNLNQARSSNNNLNYGKVTEESVTSVPRKSIVADSEIDYGR